MRFLNFRERDVVSVGHGGQLSEREADGIEKLAKFLPGGSLAWKRHAVHFGPFCGVLRTPEVTIELLPKIGRGLGTAADMRGLLVAMLAAAGELRLAKVGQADLGRQTTHLLDIFILDFCDRVRVALRGGVIALYTEKSENLNAIRGRLQLTEHLRRNAFDQSQLLCRFDERTIDNPFNCALKGVLRLLLSHSLDPRTQASVTSLLHRLDGVADRPVRVADLDALRFDRTNDHWRNVFDQVRSLLAGLFPDVRIGDGSGSALLFNMERLFEDVLGRRIMRECRKLVGRQLHVELQKPQRTLATTEFRLRPDITIQDDNQVVAILDAKWKQLTPSEPNADVSSADAYQMNAYASRYQCNRLALIYPASASCAPGHVRQFRFQTPGQSILDVVAVDIHDLAFGSTMPAGLEGVIPSERSWKQNKGVDRICVDA